MARSWMRHLPPALTPVTAADLWAGVRGSAESVPTFERALAATLGVPVCRTAATGRAAMHLLVARLMAAAPERHEVVLPAYTCPSLMVVVQALGLTPRLVDIDPATLAMPTDALARAVGDRTLLAVIVHPFGIPQPVAPAHALTQAAGAWLLEDAAQALGARLAGQPVGTLGDFGLFSLGIGKPLSTGGGGAVCARRAQPAALVADAWRALAAPTAVQSALAWLRQVAFQSVLQPRPWWLATRLGALRVGTNEASWGYRMRPLTGPQAATGRRLLDRLDAIQAQRCRNAAALRADLPARWLVAGVDSAESACLRLPLILDDEAQRDRLLHALWDAGIGAGRLYEQTLAAWFPGSGRGPYPGAERVARCLLTVPTHHLLTDRDRAVIRRLLLAAA